MLTTLDLGSNQIGIAGCLAMSEALKINQVGSLSIIISGYE